MLIIKKEKGNISGVHKMKFDLLPVIARSVRFLKKKIKPQVTVAHLTMQDFFFVLKNYFLVIIVSPEILINKIKLIAG